MIRLLVSSIVILAVPAAARASDRITLQPAGGTGRIALGGEIIDYTGRTITLRSSSDGEVHAFPAAEVVNVETPQTQHHIEGLLHFT
ncbi:MAG: hypothetical protein ACREJB_09510, partial [Planctomycetaceae bacterium]